MKMKTLTTIALILLGGTAVGCQPHYTLDFRILSAPPGEVTMNDSLIEIEEGLAAMAVVIPSRNDERMHKDTELDLSAGAAQIIRVNRLEDPDDVAERGDWYFTFAGARSGSTFLEFFVNGDYEGDVPVVIRTQAQ